ncbi:DNA-binding transcriptional regulator, MerR family [Anaerovirgula multivorans]|uniref:DNA-binding transcriptional regulator, MerR family n=1 Tax=Anaerovirgula multivorans TaxID=312168 RepID=A0A239F4S9_9FIRM|nr:MerR family transcriptional regulator [Anaerovirgula multivorans]SNS51847.1 DNA-binding transcriptional regulator, MerR family [Anaerovirgula multivorans]
MFYKTSDIARKTNIHPNTVRFYERIGLILPAPRAENGYRLFNDRHLYQVMVLRCIFLDEWPGENIRKASIKIIDAMKSWELKAARNYTKEYIQIIEIEYEKAKEAVKILKQWSDHVMVEEPGEIHSRAEAATVIGVTPEALRNWERNGLIGVPRVGKNQRRIYGRKEIERLRIIYMLRQAKYSMSAIHKCLKKFDAGCNEEALEALHNPNKEDIVWTGDHWLYVLQKTADKAEEIFKILDKIEE